MKITTKTIIRTLFMGLIAIPAGMVLAGPITWNTDSASASCTGGSGNSCTFTYNSYGLTARAFATVSNSATSSFQKATLTVWDGGLGVKSAGESSGSPQHALDNNGKKELIVFENNATDYSFTGFGIGWKYNDSDISAWVGSEVAGFDFTGKKFADLAGLGFTKMDFSNVPTNTTQSLGSLTGNFLILAPNFTADSKSDYVKIDQISGFITPPPPTNISEPGMLALMCIALVALGACGSRRTV